MMINTSMNDLKISPKNVNNIDSRRDNNSTPKNLSKSKSLDQQQNAQQTFSKYQMFSTHTRRLR